MSDLAPIYMFKYMHICICVGERELEMMKGIELKMYMSGRSSLLNSRMRNGTSVLRRVPMQQEVENWMRRTGKRLKMSWRYKDERSSTLSVSSVEQNARAMYCLAISLTSRV